MTAVKYQRVLTRRPRQSMPDTRYKKVWRMRRLHGVESTVDTAPVRAHIDQLRGWGLPYSAIARAAGVSPTAVNGIHNSDGGRCLSAMAAGILSVGYRPHPEQALCLAVGARRRVHALCALGWPMESTAETLGSTKSALRTAIRGTLISYSTWAAIAALYQQRPMTPGPSDKSRRMARRYGWDSPMAWDGIDHPDHLPTRGVRDLKFVDRVAVQRALSGDRTIRLSEAERRAVAAQAIALAWTRSDLAARLGVPVPTADKMLERARKRVAA